MGEKGIPVTRRGFLALSGAGVAGVAGSGCNSGKIADFLELTEYEHKNPGGAEKWVTSTCGQCSGGCSIRVRTVGGNAVSIAGNPLSPLNGNGLCPRGLAGLQVLYDPDRIRGPLRRAGQRGEGKWESISWDEAIRSVAQDLAKIREQGESHQVAFLSGECRGLMDELIARFCRAYGTPNDVRKLPPAETARALASYCTHGRLAPFTYDLENTDYLLSFGAPLLDGGTAPAQTLRQYGYLRQERPGSKAKIVQIEPRLSVTAAKADEWVPIHPGTEGALALGIAYVLIREGMYDRSFVEHHTFGFDDWQDESGKLRLGFKQLVVEKYHLDEVARLTGVPVAMILRLAKEFGTRKPAVAMGESVSTNAVFNLMAIHALNALVGSIDVSGGVVFPREVPLKALPALELDVVAERGLKAARLDRASTREFPLARHVDDVLTEAIAAEKPYKVSALLLYQANPLFSSPQPERVAKALEKVPLIVSFSPFLDETSAHADIILPDHTYLERWQDDPAPPVARYPHFGFRQPVVAPLYDTQHCGDVLMKIGRAIGGPVAAALPWTDFVEVMKHGVSGIFESRRGGIIEGPTTQQSWTGLVEERGWWYPTYHSFDEFWTQLQEKGGWWNPAYSFGEWDRVFPNPTGKFQFFSLTLRQALGAAGASDDKARDLMLDALKLEERGDLVYLPHFEPPRFAGEEASYPLHLNVIRLMPLAEPSHASQPFLQEILAPHLHIRWDSWLEINPETALHLGIADGDMVWVESPVGKVKVRARHYAGAMPEVVNIPANLGHTAGGRFAKGIGVNPMLIAAAEHDHLAGIVASGATRVKVYKA